MLPTRRLSISVFVALALLTVSLSLIGLVSRPVEHLSLFWPVNAILLGLLLRKPRWAHPITWPVLYLSMLLADLLWGSPLLSSLWMNLCNIAMILTGWLMLHRQPRTLLRLRKPRASLVLFSAVLCGAAVSATLATLAQDAWFNHGTLSTWSNWFCEQFLTAFLLLPVILTAPPVRVWHRLFKLPDLDAEDVLALVCLAIAMAALLTIGGPGAIGFPLLPLLWCAMRFNPFTVAVLSLLTGTLVLILASIQPQLGGLSSLLQIAPINSARLGIAMLVLAPLAVVGALEANRHLLRRINHRANHDFLTGAMNRRALSYRLHNLLENNLRRSDSRTWVMLLDLDHFKRINDQYGHAEGDEVLRRFAKIVRNTLRQQDLFARIGGEEFVAVLSGVSLEQARSIADRVRANVEQAEFPQQLKVTVSIGLDQLRPEQAGEDIDQMLIGADQALYQAKHLGRNRVISLSTFALP